MVNKEAGGFGSGVGAGGRARSGGADTGRPDRTAADAAGRQADGGGGDGGRRRAGWWQPTSRPAYLLGCDVRDQTYFNKSKLACKIQATHTHTHSR